MASVASAGGPSLVKWVMWQVKTSEDQSQTEAHDEPEHMVRARHVSHSQTSLRKRVPAPPKRSFKDPPAEVAFIQKPCPLVLWLVLVVSFCLFGVPFDVTKIDHGFTRFLVVFASEGAGRFGPCRWIPYPRQAINLSGRTALDILD